MYYLNFFRLINDFRAQYRQETARLIMKEIDPEGVEIRASKRLKELDDILEIWNTQTICPSTKKCAFRSSEFNVHLLAQLPRDILLLTLQKILDVCLEYGINLENVVGLVIDNA
ncbi:hypothetical protein KUTeg_017455 [Tegillarca granosa]|uniref:Uncharacterized protein n=1 Tax=Tegillarca granosa TaxID=220873 RepID=A0ABQ9EIV5_TEGGR|nr:hypothetical protein KUTeg_017455 [Tegillarca granosa]